ncbi:hypothetical protein SKAU_G00167730 [Synaphobranchus kaupii]|uniref:Uncharacterized protein n=1 Tax=Synaphobranchus kaupii TaxID=118154 RepID=A0A9Q1FJS6_SYNKA|nr:hypothetical protein SKAU_G00167730 [Synaphobranchus kaupii]
MQRVSLWQMNMLFDRELRNPRLPAGRKRHSLGARLPPAQRGLRPLALGTQRRRFWRFACVCVWLSARGSLCPGQAGVLIANPERVALVLLASL